MESHRDVSHLRCFFYVSMIYADELQIYLSGDSKDLDEMTSALNEDLAAIARWSAENGFENS
jgi:hypothetical protein